MFHQKEDSEVADMGIRKILIKLMIAAVLIAGIGGLYSIFNLEAPLALPHKNFQSEQNTTQR